MDFFIKGLFIGFLLIFYLLEEINEGFWKAIKKKFSKEMLLKLKEFKILGIFLIFFTKMVFFSRFFSEFLACFFQFFYN